MFLLLFKFWFVNIRIIEYLEYFDKLNGNVGLIQIDIIIYVLLNLKEIKELSSYLDSVDEFQK